MLPLLMPIQGTLRQLRTEAGMTQQSLAEAAGLSISAPVQIESGKIPDPRVRTLRSLAKALGVSLDDLAGEGADAELPASKKSRGRPRKGE